ncbi:unnamed protein product [Thlaspi arvense]|uniref:Uncharacterized protein n=1 Tax=Thlaspi arvense TaxID=13288 RepID=A0AAU9T2E9_THLAR|nr:unnamed protein product [Thlaspi arvense]
MVGVFMSSWLGASVLSIGEWFIKKMPLINYIYSASKQISGAISLDQSSGAFKEVAIIRHPHMGEYAFRFITSIAILRGRTGGEELCCVYVPTTRESPALPTKHQAPTEAICGLFFHCSCTKSRNSSSVATNALVITSGEIPRCSDVHLLI